tara:strand:+ start:22467 stop:23120 length:654 start_codon:yes stop_codon:yes gene_type:complete
MSHNTKNSSALIINGGPSPEKRVLDYLPKFDEVLAVDSGFDNATSLGIVPDVVIGDLDSISAGGLETVEKKSIEIISFPENKDKSDLELAILHASRTCGSVTIVDSGGGRVDHMWGVFSAMVSNANSMISCEAFVGSSYVKVVRDAHEVKPLASNLVSIFPFGGIAEGVSLSGFRWNLNHETLNPGSTRGLSNEIVDSSGNISVQKGVLLVIQPDLY